MGFLADNNFGDTRSGGLAGPMGLLLIIILGTVTVLLIRNMSKRIKRLPSNFDNPADLPEAGPTHSDAVPPTRSGDPEAVDRIPGTTDNLP
jgi:hypothetical protein